MLQVTDVSLRFGDRKLFEDVNIKFTEGNCYGLIGANGSGKSTFIKILSGELDAQSGHVSMGKNERLAILKQDHFAYENERVIDVVIKGHERLYEVMKEKDEIYMKPDFSDEDGIRAAELEGEFAEMDGWNAEADAGSLLSGLGVSADLQDKKMSELENNQKVKVYENSSYRALHRRDRGSAGEARQDVQRDPEICVYVSDVSRGQRKGA